MGVKIKPGSTVHSRMAEEMEPWEPQPDPPSKVVKLASGGIVAGSGGMPKETKAALLAMKLAALSKHAALHTPDPFTQPHPSSIKQVTNADMKAVEAKVDAWWLQSALDGKHDVKPYKELSTADTQTPPPKTPKGKKWESDLAGYTPGKKAAPSNYSLGLPLPYKFSGGNYVATSLGDDFDLSDISQHLVMTGQASFLEGITVEWEMDYASHSWSIVAHFGSEHASVKIGQHELDVMNQGAAMEHIQSRINEAICTVVYMAITNLAGSKATEFMAQYKL